MFALLTQEPFASMLIDGSKPIESREYQIPLAIVGEPVSIIVSDGTPPESLSLGSELQCVGQVVFRTCEQYNNEIQWLADEPLHRVNYDKYPAYRWKNGISKFAWKVAERRAQPRTLRARRIEVLKRSVLRIDVQDRETAAKL